MGASGERESRRVFANRPRHVLRCTGLSLMAIYGLGAFFHAATSSADRASTDEDRFGSIADRTVSATSTPHLGISTVQRPRPPFPAGET